MARSIGHIYLSQACPHPRWDSTAIETTDIPCMELAQLLRCPLSCMQHGVLADTMTAALTAVGGTIMV